MGRAHWAPTLLLQGRHFSVTLPLLRGHQPRSPRRRQLATQHGVVCCLLFAWKASKLIVALESCWFKYVICFQFIHIIDVIFRFIFLSLMCSGLCHVFHLLLFDSPIAVILFLIKFCFMLQFFFLQRLDDGRRRQMITPSARRLGGC